MLRREVSALRANNTALEVEVALLRAGDVGCASVKPVDNMCSITPQTGTSLKGLTLRAD